jgi:uncharacterized protein YqeY
MSLFQTIQDEAKKAMLARDEFRLNTLRSVKAVFSNELMNKPGKTDLFAVFASFKKNAQNRRLSLAAHSGAVFARK